MLHRIHIILVLLPTVSRCHCPPNNTQVSADVCTIQLDAAHGICDACNLCSKFGKQHNQLVFLHGRNVNLVKSILQPNSKAWNGMNGLLGIPDSRSVAGWRDLDPRTPEFTSGPDQFKWGDNQPKGNEPHLIFHKRDEAMYDVFSAPMNSTREVHCEYGGELPKENLNIRFKADFPERFNNIVQPQPDFLGCPLTLNAVTEIDCARRCTLDFACRSIYFNDNGEQCIHMQHADSLLPHTIAKSQEGWSRFAKTAYGNP